MAITKPTSDDILLTMAIFEAPGNLRYPAKKFTMSLPFAHLSAKLNLWNEPFYLKAGEPLKLCYGMAVWDETIHRIRIEKLYQRWLKSAQRSISAC